MEVASVIWCAIYFSRPDLLQCKQVENILKIKLIACLFSFQYRRCQDEKPCAIVAIRSPGTARRPRGGMIGRGRVAGLRGKQGGSTGGSVRGEPRSYSA